MCATSRKTLRTCPQGHKYYKSSDCPVCPICEQAKQPDEGFMSLLAAPARRALQNAQIDTLTQLANHTEKEIRALHGISKNAMNIFLQQLEKAGLSFRK